MFIKLLLFFLFVFFNFSHWAFALTIQCRDIFIKNQNQSKSSSVNNEAMRIFQRNSGDLEKRVSIINRYLEPHETRILVENVDELYSKSPETLVETINILKDVYSFSEKMSPLGKKFIADLMRKNLGSLLLANPKHLRKLVTLLEDCLDGKRIAEFLRKNPLVFLSIDPIHFQNIRKALEQYLGEPRARGIIVNHFHHLILIEQSKAFVEIVKIMDSHIGEKDALYESIDSLLREMHLFSGEYNSLYANLRELNSKLDSHEMERRLTNGEIDFLSKKRDDLHKNLRALDSRPDSQARVSRALERALRDSDPEKVDKILREQRVPRVSTVDSIHFRNIRRALEQYLGEYRAREIIANHFHHLYHLILTKQSYFFTAVVDILASHIGEKDILYRRIDDLLMEMHLFSKEYDSLYENLWELNLRLDSDGKKRVFENPNISLLELSYYQYQ